jgi:hypothetical protein
MRILRDIDSINTEIRQNTDRQIANQLTRHVQFDAEYHDPDVGELLTVFLVEPGDTLHTIDDAMDGCFLTNHYSRRQLGDPEFVPCFETLEEHSTFYEVLFIQSDEGHALLILVPKRAGIDPELLSLCAKYATPAESPS